MNSYRYLVMGMLLGVLFGGAALALRWGHPSIALLFSSLFCLAAAEHIYNLSSRNPRVRALASSYLLRPVSLLLPCAIVALLWYSAGHR